MSKDSQSHFKRELNDRKEKRIGSTSTTGGVRIYLQIYHHSFVARNLNPEAARLSPPIMYIISFDVSFHSLSIHHTHLCSGGLVTTLTHRKFVGPSKCNVLSVAFSKTLIPLPSHRRIIVALFYSFEIIKSRM